MRELQFKAFLAVTAISGSISGGVAFYHLYKTEGNNDGIIPPLFYATCGAAVPSLGYMALRTLRTPVVATAGLFFVIHEAAKKYAPSASSISDENSSINNRT